MRLTYRAALASLVVVSLFAVPGMLRAAEKDHWEKLGERKVDYKLEKDVIEVGRVEGRFTSIRLEVEDGDLEMHKLTITMGDGKEFSPETRFVFKEGSRSHVIDLPGDARVIRRIEFVYKSEHHNEKAMVKVFGKKA